jgi:hypothetical protein
MTRYQLFLSASIIALETLLCILVYLRSLQKRLPFFAAYTATILTSCLSQLFVYMHYGFRADISFYYLGLSYAFVMLLRSAAVAELCLTQLKPYRGIWALTRRLLGLMTFACILHAAIDARGQAHWFTAYGLTIERDVDIASFLILTTMLLIGNYYRLPIENIHRWIALGICFFCVIEFANSSVFRNLLAQYMSSGVATKAQVNRINDLWNTIYVVASAASLGSWCYLLRKPLPETATHPVLLPAGFYQELSPAINLRLRAFNDRLEEMLKS